MICKKCMFFPAHFLFWRNRIILNCTNFQCQTLIVATRCQSWQYFIVPNDRGRVLMMQFHVNLYMFSLVSAFLWNTWEDFVKRLYSWHVYTSRWVCTYSTSGFVRTAPAGHGRTDQYGHWLDTKCKSKAVVNTAVYHTTPYTMHGKVNVENKRHHHHHRHRIISSSSTITIILNNSDIK